MGNKTFTSTSTIALLSMLMCCADGKGPKLNNQPQIGRNILEIIEDSDGNLWFGTTENGVARYDGKHLVYFTSEDGLCGNTVANMAEDNNGKIWLGTYTDLCIYDPNASQNKNVISFLPFAKKDSVPFLGWGWKNVKTDPQGNIWVNTHHGIFRFKDSNFTEFKVPVKKANGPSFCSTPGIVSMDLIDSNGNMWFGTDGEGAYSYDGTSFTQYTKEDGLISDNVTNIKEDKNGHIWFACIQPNEAYKNGSGGVCRLERKNKNKNKDDNFKPVVRLK